MSLVTTKPSANASLTRPTRSCCSLLVVVTLYPFVYVVFALAEPAVAAGPPHGARCSGRSGFSRTAYKLVFENPMILIGYATPSSTSSSAPRSTCS